MRIVLRKPGIRLGDLSKEVSLSHSTVSGIVDRLEKRGLVKRDPDDLDRRIMRVRPTPQVDSWIQEQLPTLKLGPLQAALQRADPAECDAIEHAVSRLRKLLSRT
jgi:DNA-binding MarR family transcriptional regulator